MNKALGKMLLFVTRITAILVWIGLACWALSFMYRRLKDLKTEIVEEFDLFRDKTDISSSRILEGRYQKVG